MSASTPESTVQGSTFEGLFVRALQPRGDFADALRSAGYDATAPRAQYPRHVWLACMEVARRHEYPYFPPEQGLRLLGRRFVEGFRKTLTGKLQVAVMPMLSPATVMQRLPRTWATTQPNMRVRSEELAPGHWQFTLEDEGIVPDFVAGMLDAILAMMSVSEPDVRVHERAPARCVVDVRWRA
jgi:uncharacterized protein (TIGR02265 family)